MTFLVMYSTTFSFNASWKHRKLISYIIRQFRTVIYSCVCAHAQFARLSSDWATATARQLGRTSCLPHKYGGTPLSALHKDTPS